MKQTKEVKAILKEIDSRIKNYEFQRDGFTWNDPQFRTFVDKEDSMKSLRAWIAK